MSAADMLIRLKAREEILHDLLDPVGMAHEDQVSRAVYRHELRSLELS